MFNFVTGIKDSFERKQMAATVAMLATMTTSQSAFADSFFQPFCAALDFFSGKSPLVAFVLMAGGLGILVTLLIGEDRGMLMSIIKWVAGGAGMVGLSSLITRFFPQLGAICGA